MDYLEKGFDTQQASQLMKLEEYNIKISKYINPDVSVSKLRELKNILSNPKVKESKRNLVTAYFIKNNYDITKFLEKDVEYENCIKELYNMELEGFDITSLIDPKLNIEKLRLIHKYLREKNINIKEYLLKGYSENVIELLPLYESVNVSIDDLINAGYSENKFKPIYLAYKAGFKILDYINIHYSEKQIKALIYAYELGIDIKKVLDIEYSGATIKAIAEALKEGIDITGDLKTNKTVDMVNVLVSAKKMGLDVNKFNEIEDIKQLRTTFALLKLDKDLDIDLSKYDNAQLSAIKHIADVYRRKDVIVEILNPKFSDYQMETIANAVVNKKDLSLLKIEGLNNRQIKSLVEASKIADLRGLVDKNTTPSMIESLAVIIKNGYIVKRK